MADRDKWASQQIAAAIAAGVHVIDASNAMRDYLAKLPPGAELGSLLAVGALEQDITSEAIEADARAAWYGSGDVSPTFKRLLDATETR